MRRHLHAISLVGFLILPGSLVFLALQVQKSHIRHDIKERLIAGMDRADLETLKFAIKDIDHLLEWEHEREFEYLGQMYDIVEQEEAGDSITYICWPDGEETRLNELLSTLTLASLADDPFDQTSHQRLSDFFKSLYIIDLCDDGRKTTSYQNILNCPRLSFPSSRLTSPPTPPPDLA